MVGFTSEWIDQTFPGSQAGYALTSPPSDEYNCIAYAAGDTTSWWSYVPGYNWPAGVKRGDAAEYLIAVFEDMRYKVCNDAGLETGYEKVAIYANAGLWTHAARQLPDGRWTSKLGPGEDIEHATPDVLEGDAYGAVRYIMRRERQ